MPEPLTLTPLNLTETQAQNNPVQQTVVTSGAKKEEQNNKSSGFLGFFKNLFQKNKKSPSLTLSSAAPSSLSTPSSEVAKESNSVLPALNLNPIVSAPHLNPVQSSSAVVTKTGNLFTRLFKASKVEQEEGSIIDAIVDKTESEKNKQKEEKKALKEAEKLAQKKLREDNDDPKWFRASRVFFHFTILFIAVGTGFLYIQIVDVNNSVFDWFNGPKNYASRLHEAQAQLDELNKQERALKGEVVVFQEGYKDPNENVVKKIVDQRSSWPEVEKQLYGAAEVLYPLNYFNDRLEFTNFNVNFETGQVSFTASLKDPSDNNFTALADFENILKFYPGEPGQKEGVKPYFTDLQDINSYSKRYDANTDTYETIFSMTAKINSDAI